MINELRLRLPLRERNELTAETKKAAEVKEDDYESRRALKVAQATVSSLQVHRTENILYTTEIKSCYAAEFRLILHWLDFRQRCHTVYVVKYLPAFVNGFRFCYFMFWFNCLQQMLARKDDSLVKYQEMLKEAREVRSQRQTDRRTDRQTDRQTKNNSLLFG